MKLSAEDEIFALKAYGHYITELVKKIKVSDLRPQDYSIQEYRLVKDAIGQILSRRRIAELEASLEDSLENQEGTEEK